MAAGVYGADLEAMAQLGRRLDGKAAALTSLTNAATNDVNALDRLWDGPDSAQFKQLWLRDHRPKMNRAVQELREAAAAIERNRQAQEQTSTADAAGGLGLPTVLGTGPLMASQLLGANLPLGRDVLDFIFGDVANFWNGGRDDGLPVGQLSSAALKILRMAQGQRPLFNTGFVGQTLISLLDDAPGVLGRSGAWLASPAATTFFKRAGIAGGVASTGMGLYNLYQQGNPIDAFQANEAGYVGDVASTVFSASTTAFLLTGNPAFAAVAVGSGVVWIGAEVVENWDDITAWTSDAWDTGTDFVGDIWDGGTDFVGDVWDGGSDLAADAWDAGSDFVGDVGDGAADLAGDAWDAGSDLVGTLTSPSDWF